MSRILLDQNAPAGLRQLLKDHDVKTAYQMGWAAIVNGLLLDVAERAGFDILVTADQNIRSQQNLTGRKIAMVVLTTNHWLTVRSGAAAVRAACERARQGSYTVVSFPRPPRRPRLPSQ